MTAAIRLPERAAADALIAAMREEMPLLAFMGVEVVACDGHSLTLQAPLAPNRNDKGTAFAGSLASLSTVTGWALLTLWAQAQGLPCQVAVFHTEIRYRRPIVQLFKATAMLPDDAALAALRDQLLTRSKARVTLNAVVVSAEGEAVEQVASYALWRI